MQRCTTAELRTAGVGKQFRICRNYCRGSNFFLLLPDSYSFNSKCDAKIISRCDARSGEGERRPRDGVAVQTLLSDSQAAGCGGQIGGRDTHATHTQGPFVTLMAAMKYFVDHPNVLQPQCSAHIFTVNSSAEECESRDAAENPESHL